MEAGYALVTALVALFASLFSKSFKLGFMVVREMAGFGWPGTVLFLNKF